MSNECRSDKCLIDGIYSHVTRTKVPMLTVSSPDTDIITHKDFTDC